MFLYFCLLGVAGFAWSQTLTSNGFSRHLPHNNIDYKQPALMPMIRPVFDFNMQSADVLHFQGLMTKGNRQSYSLFSNDLKSISQDARISDFTRVPLKAVTRSNRAGLSSCMTPMDCSTADEKFNTGNDSPSLLTNFIEQRNRKQLIENEAIITDTMFSKYIAPLSVLESREVRDKTNSFYSQEDPDGTSSKERERNVVFIKNLRGEMDEVNDAKVSLDTEYSSPEMDTIDTSDRLNIYPEDCRSAIPGIVTCADNAVETSKAESSFPEKASTHETQSSDVVQIGSLTVNGRLINITVEKVRKTFGNEFYTLSKSSREFIAPLSLGHQKAVAENVLNLDFRVETDPVQVEEKLKSVREAARQQQETDEPIATKKNH